MKPDGGDGLSRGKLLGAIATIPAVAPLAAGSALVAHVPPAAAPAFAASAAALAAAPAAPAG